MDYIEEKIYRWGIIYRKNYKKKLQKKKLYKRKTIQKKDYIKEKLYYIKSELYRYINKKLIR